MKKRILQMMCLVLVMALLCCGCNQPESAHTESTQPESEQKETEPVVLMPAEVAVKMQEALEQTPCGKVAVTMDMNMSIAAEGMNTVEMSTKTSTQTTLCMDPVSSYSTATVETSYMGMNTQTQSESYTVVEEGAVVTYAYSDGVWLKTVTEQTPEAFSKTLSTVHVDADSAVIDETVTQWNGKEVLCLKSEMTGDSIQSTVDGILGSMGETLGGNGELLSEADYTKLSCSSLIYLNPETYLPMAEEMTFSGLSEVMVPLFQEQGITVEIPVYTAKVEFLTYEPQPAVTLPDGAAQKAEAWSRLLANEPDNGDGTFTIREGGALIDLVHPEGFAVKEKDYDHVKFQREDYRTITYTMYYTTGADTTGVNFLATNDSSEERWTTLGGGEVDRKQVSLTTESLTFTCDLLATTWETGRTDANFYAWTVLGTDADGTYYLYVEVTDGYNDGMGFSKSADITADDFSAYLNAAAPSKLTVE